MQIQISWLLQKPTDLALHCLQRQGITRFSRTRVKWLVLKGDHRSQESREKHYAGSITGQKWKLTTKGFRGMNSGQCGHRIRDSRSLMADCTECSMKTKVNICNYGCCEVLFQLCFTVSIISITVVVILVVQKQ